MPPGALASPSIGTSHAGQRLPRPRQLPAHQQHQQEADQQEAEGGDAVLQPYCLVVGKAHRKIDRVYFSNSAQRKIDPIYFPAAPGPLEYSLMNRTTLAAILCAVALSFATTGPLQAQAPEPIRYTLRFPAPQTHYVEVEAAVPTGRRADVEVYMAVWTPGSYLVREYERNVEAVTATADGRALAVEKTKKNRWKVTTGGAATVTVRYKVYSREMTVRNNWVEAGFAMINGAPTFLTLVEPRVARPHEVKVELPAAWKGVQTPLMPVAGSPNAFRADDFDQLVDSPIIIGNPVVREFTVDGKKHALVLEGDPSFFDADRAAADVQKIVVAAKGVMGPYIYPHYYFLNLVTESGGGLEHKNSFMGMTGRYTTRTHRAYLGWLGLISHEYFHNWNVKRLRPVELGPFDYENENYVKTLWVAEGFTDYYSDVLLSRAEARHARGVSRRPVEPDRAGADDVRAAR